MREGYQVSHACSGTEVLLVLQAEKPDLVLLDRICEDTPDCMENSLKVHVSSLRRKMKEDTGKNYMEDASLFLYIDLFIKICRCERRDF